MAATWATQANAQKYYNTLTPEQRKDVPMNDLVNWFTNAVNAGVPDAVKAAGGRAGSGESGWEIEGGYTLDPTGANAAPPDEWLGKRPPSPSELRRYAREAGWSEDFQRYTDRQVAAWINEGWDVQGNAFRNPGGDLVEKPTEESANWQGVTGGKGGGATPKAPAAAPQPEVKTYDPLQQRLLEMFAGGEGNFATDRAVGQNLEGGGIWWSGTDQDKTDANPAATANQTGPATAVNRRTANGVNPALASAVLTAFTPSAPSQNQGQTSIPPPTGAPTGTYTGTGWNPSTTAVSPTQTAPTTQPQPTRQTSPATGGSELEAAVNKRFNNPNSWWAGANLRNTM